MPPSNFHINRAREQKRDEFYTQMPTIQDELIYYLDDLKGKRVYCNCDHNSSNFFKYFCNNFDKYDLKALVSCDKDFRSQESIDLLKTSDVVITNPPFSLWREYVQQLLQYDKKFIILGRLDMSKYKIIANHICNEKIFLGKSLRNGDVHFQVPNRYKEHYKKNGKSFIRVPGIRFYQNIKPFSSPPLSTNVKYAQHQYERYTNYSAINIDRTKDIPMDYFNPMGVPISYIDKHCYDQFDLISMNPYVKLKNRNPYGRIIIQRKGYYRKPIDLFSN